jgi:Domain of unknown function (DUF5655)/Domain of unknown function (DUF4287)
MAKSPEEALATMIENLESKTGRSLPQWLEITRAGGLEKHGAVVAFLKKEHGVTHGFANLIAHKTLAAGSAPASGDDLIAAQYAGAKAALRPIYERLVAAVVKFGDDVEISPKKTCVSLRRNKQFGQIQAATRTRVDVGLNLKGVAPTGRLEAAGGMCSHRVRVTAADQVDGELLGWLEQAYDAS